MTLRAFFTRLWRNHGLFIVGAILSIFTLWVLPAIATAATAPTAPVAPTVPFPSLSIGVGGAKSPTQVVEALQILCCLRCWRLHRRCS